MTGFALSNSYYLGFFRIHGFIINSPGIIALKCLLLANPEQLDTLTVVRAIYYHNPRFHFNFKKVLFKIIQFTKIDFNTKVKRI